MLSSLQILDFGAGDFRVCDYFTRLNFVPTCRTDTGPSCASAAMSAQLEHRGVVR